MAEVRNWNSGTFILIKASVKMLLSLSPDSQRMNCAHSVSIELAEYYDVVLSSITHNIHTNYGYVVLMCARKKLMS